MTPRVSIGMPVHNGEKFISAALDSILAQDFSDFELIISDNASTDATGLICQDYMRRDSRINYSRLPHNIGAAKNYNRVFERSSGEFFKWAAHDDIISRDFLSKCVSKFDELADDTVLAYPKTRFIDADGHPLEMSYEPDCRTDKPLAERIALMLGNADHTQSILHRCHPVSGLIRRRALQKTSLIANMPRSDNLLLVQLALLGPMVPIDEELFFRRHHEGASVVSAEKRAKGPELERILARWFDPQRGKYFPATRTRLGLGYLTSALRTPMCFKDRVSVLRTILIWMTKNRRAILGEIKIVFFELVTWRRFFVKSSA